MWAGRSDTFCSTWSAIFFGDAFLALDCLDNEGIRPGWTTVYASCRTLKCVPCQALVVGESVMASLLTAVIIGGVASLVVASRE